MAWWQKKLLHYALARTGLFDDTALDQKNLDVTLGRKNVIELKDVGLNIKRLGQLTHLPPSLRVETARVLTLRLTVPADIYQSSIIAEVDGLVVSLSLEEKDAAHIGKEKTRARSPTTERSPQHRKVHRRLHSPPLHDPGGLNDSYMKEHMPTTQEMARSFLLEEPAQEVRELEATLVTDTASMEQSISSGSSVSEMGTGAPMGLPGFLAGFLQGILDRLQVVVRNTEIKIDATITSDVSGAIPFALRLTIAKVELTSLGSDGDDGGDRGGKRNLRLQDVRVDIISDNLLSSGLSEFPPRSSAADSRRPSEHTLAQSVRTVSSVAHPGINPKTSSVNRPSALVAASPHDGALESSNSLQESALTNASYRSAFEAEVAGEEHGLHRKRSTGSDLDIQLGDDNISWGSRRVQAGAVTEDLWNSIASEDELPDSLLLERAATPRASSSRGQSPNISRSRRAVSPYDRSLQSPGLWPRPRESLEHSTPHRSPGSWPMLDQSQYSLSQPLIPGPGSHLQDITDNKRTALESSSHMAFGAPQTATLTDDHPEDMAQSRFYSHEEAASIYMSAISQGSNPGIPGAWASDSTPSELSLDTQIEKSSLLLIERQNSEPLSEDAESSQDPDLVTGDVTPRVQSPRPESPFGRRQSHSQQVVSIDHLSVWLPAQHEDQEEDIQKTPPRARRAPVDASVSAHGMPGTFSAYSEIFSPEQSDRRTRASHATRVSQNSPLRDEQTVEILLGNVKAQIDLPGARILHHFSQSIIALLRTEPRRTGKDLGSAATAEGATSIRIAMEQIEVSLLDSVAERQCPSPDPLPGLITIKCENVRLDSTDLETKIQFNRATCFVGSTVLISFDHPGRTSDSSMPFDDSSDINLLISKRLMLTGRSVSDITLETLQIRLNLDLVAADETLSTFGGISGVLELGGSMISEGSTSWSPSAPSKASKGVRFQDEPEARDTSPELKVNVRLGGCDLTLQGDTCMLNLRSNTIKIIHREHGTIIAVPEVRFTGPLQPGQPNAPIMAVVSDLRFEYIISPPEKDLERLLSLLTPSKNKYDTDDDILIDTLLRQRRKAALARVILQNAKIHVADFSCFETLATLGDELSKLSVVTKYLPEDDRPGLLTLIRCNTLEAHLPVNKTFGEVQILCTDLQVAHVGLPALLALSFGTVSAGHIDRFGLIHPLIPTSEIDNLPMIMARMIGNEAEPLIKIKLYNVSVEYDVPTLLAITQVDTGTDVEKIVTELANSVANLTLNSEAGRIGHASPTNNTTKQSPRKTKIELLVHDSAIGLTPNKLPSKCLLVLTHATFLTTIPPGDALDASLELKQAAMFVVDSVARSEMKLNAPIMSRLSNTATSPHVTEYLSKRGYASVASLMAAKLSVNVEDDRELGSKYVTVNISNELLLLESCADTTQTLFATLGALSPPTPPSKQPKYLTEPMTIEDMMASFTGDPETTLTTAPETLFDADEDVGAESDVLLDAPTLYENDDLLLDSEMTSSLYGPVSGTLGGFDKPDDDNDGTTEVYPETVESLLEEDPFEMPSSSADTGLSDAALMRDLTRQCKSAIGGASIDLGLYEIEDLGFDALGTDASTLGERYRFSTPTSTRRGLHPSTYRPKLPFRLRLRDTHLIWNIHDGYDWQRTRDGITQAVEQVEAKADERKNRRRQSMDEREDDEPIIGDFLFNSIYIGVPGNHDAQELRRQINRGIDDLVSETESVPMSGMSRPTSYSTSGRPIRSRQRRRLKLKRSKKHKIAFELKGLSADVIVFPPDSGDVVSSVDIRVRDCEIFDNVPTSTWRKFLTQLDGHPGSREMAKPMAHIELLNVRTLQDYAASEIVLHVSILPLRLHVDQDALDFITRFFEFKDDSTTVSDAPSEQPFIQRIEVDTVDLQLDYKPKYVDYAGLRSGHTTEFMNFVTLDAANIRLKHAIVYGIRGFEPLHKTLNDVWMPDVMRNQLPTVLASLAPVRSLVNIGSGVRDIVAIPVREYRKDGRIVRSIQKGAFHFGKTTASELARLGAKVAIGTQTMLQGAEGFLSTGSASPSGRASSEQGWHDVLSEDDESEQRAVSAYANQPLGLLPGLRSARRYLEHDLLTARDALIAVQGEVLESNNPGAAAAAVAKHAPTVILRPVIGATRAIGTALLGVGNQIDRENVKRMEDKYKR